MVAAWLCPFRVAVTVALWPLLTVPEVAVKVALLWPEGTVTLGGTVSSPLPLLSETAAAVLVDLFSVTVQVLDPLLPNVDGAHASDVSCAAALAVILKVWEMPFSVAVKTAV